MFNHIVARLNRFEVYANLKVFIKIYGSLIGGQLWHKFNMNHSCSSVKFFMSLNFKNQSLLITYLERYTKDY